MNTATAFGNDKLVELDKQNCLDDFLQSIHRKGWLGSAFIKDDESKRIKAFFISDNQEIVGDQEKIKDDWHFHLVTRNRLFFEQRMKDDHTLLFEMTIMEIAVDEEGVFAEVKETALKDIREFQPSKQRIEKIEASFKKAVVGAESCKKNNGNLSTMIIISKVEEMLELLFLKNSKPFPGTVYGYRHYRGLEMVPSGFSQMFEMLLESRECIMRTERFSQCVQMLLKL